MNGPEENQCVRCGVMIPSQSTDELCPACLMSGALDPTLSKAETFSVAKSGSVPRRAVSDFPFEFGGYRLLGMLGAGGMGTVYEAEHVATGRRVALKMLEQQLDSPEMRKRFLREGRLAASVNHPNSLYIFGSEEIEGVPVITMEIVGGGTLKDKLRKRGPLPVTEAVDSILDVISGLEAAYAGGVLHRDIKPSNCFVCPDGSVKVGDFGLSVSTLAKDDSYVTATGVIMGTPAFASPEQLRGDELDLRTDIYSVGATLFTLLSGQAPFEGRNAAQVVANAVNKEPKPLSELREEVPPGLERVVARCLAKEPEDRYSDYMALRNALLPFSSKEPEPASMKLRASAGWIDYLAAFLVPYVILMLIVGNEEFHLRFLLERSLYSARYYLAFLTCGFLYFSVVEGIWGAGIGKRLKGLCVVRLNGRLPGIGRAFLRIFIPVLCIEVVRIPLLLATVSATRIDDLTSPEILVYIASACICPWIPGLLAMRARPENNFVTFWDLVSGTRVVVRPEGMARPSIEALPRLETPAETPELFGPYRVLETVAPGEWVSATDPVLRRQVWLLKRNSWEPSSARRNLARPGRPRWLQKVETGEGTWDAFEATQGVPFSKLVENGKTLPWSTLRHWLHDLASELWSATADKTLPAELHLGHIWITSQGRALLLDKPWPDAKLETKPVPVGDVAGQQRFLNAVAACVESISLPLHARPVLANLKRGKFEKLSFLTGILRGLLDKPADIGRGIRAGSIFMLPLYSWIILFVGFYTGEGAWERYGSGVSIFLISAMLVLGASALIQLLELPFRTTASYSIFRLAVVDSKGERAGIRRLLMRWAIVWLPLLLPMSFVVLLMIRGELVPAVAITAISLFLWIGAAVTAILHPNRGLHDRLSGTWVVRR